MPIHASEKRFLVVLVAATQGYLCYIGCLVKHKGNVDVSQETDKMRHTWRLLAMHRGSVSVQECDAQDRLAMMASPA